MDPSRAYIILHVLGVHKIAVRSEKYKKRASHEWKNGEMKRFHGLDRARGYGLKSVNLQAKLTALAVNLKRIAALATPILLSFTCFFLKRHEGGHNQGGLLA